MILTRLFLYTKLPPAALKHPLPLFPSRELIHKSPNSHHITNPYLIQFKVVLYYPGGGVWWWMGVVRMQYKANSLLELSLATLTFLQSVTGDRLLNDLVLVTESE